MKWGCTANKPVCVSNGERPELPPTDPSKLSEPKHFKNKGPAPFWAVMETMEANGVSAGGGGV